MSRWHVFVAPLVVLAFVGLGPCQEAPSVLAAHGAVEKAEKDVLTVKTRGPDGKFGKSLVLKVTGTTHVTTLATRAQGGKVVVTQKETEAKDLQPKQAEAVIYAEAAGETVLLSAVAQPAGK